MDAIYETCHANVKPLKGFFMLPKGNKEEPCHQNFFLHLNSCLQIHGNEVKQQFFYLNRYLSQYFG